MQARWWIVAALLCLETGTARSQTPTPRIINITAERFSFTPSEIVVDAGEEVELRLKSDDTAHGFRVAGTTVSVVIPKRGYRGTVTRLRVDEPGRYTFECTRMCGAGHNFMRGTLIVRPRTSQP